MKLYSVSLKKIVVKKLASGQENGKKRCMESSSIRAEVVLVDAYRRACVMFSKNQM